jgi:hypothetical protein
MTPHRTRRAFILHIDLDPVPGTFNTPRSANETVQAWLDRFLSDYTPVVIFGVTHPAEKQVNGRKRVCFVINIDLYHDLTRISDENEMLNVLRSIISSFSHYNPKIEVAPDNIQPINCHEGLARA